MLSFPSFRDHIIRREERYAALHAEVTRAFTNLARIPRLQVSGDDPLQGLPTQFVKIASMQAMSELTTVLSCADAASKEMCAVADKLSETRETLREASRELTQLEVKESQAQQHVKELKEREQTERMTHQMKMLELRSRLTVLLAEKSAADHERDELQRINLAQWRPRREIVGKLRSLLDKETTRNKRLVLLMNSD